jgi:hypothetical protein
VLTLAYLLLKNNDDSRRVRRAHRSTHAIGAHGAPYRELERETRDAIRFISSP